MTNTATMVMSMGKKLLENPFMNWVMPVIERSRRAMMVPVTWLSKYF